MNIFLWVFQILLAVHTVIGAVWKFSHTAEQTMPSLKAMPTSVWLGLSVLEILCAVALVVPMFSKSLVMLAVVGAVLIAGEMLLFTGVHLVSGDRSFGPIVYWLIVVAWCSFIAYGRLALRPLDVVVTGA